MDPNPCGWKRVTHPLGEVNYVTLISKEVLLVFLFERLKLGASWGTVPKDKTQQTTSLAPPLA